MLKGKSAIITGSSRGIEITYAKNVADVALFLASDMAEFITGENINVNGGSYMN